MHAIDQTPADPELEAIEPREEATQRVKGTIIDELAEQELAKVIVQLMKRLKDE